MKQRFNLSTLRKFLWLAAWSCCLVVLQVHAQLELRTSVKFILSSTGTRPPGGLLLTDFDVREAFTNMNKLLDTFGRGYHFRVTEIVDIAGHPEVYNVETKIASELIRLAVDNDPTAYGWRTGAANMYINNDDTGGSAFNGMVVVSHNAKYKGILHESGHHFGLCHTQGCGCQWCTNCFSIVDDLVGDTLPDRECWTFNEIAASAFPAVYPNLSPAQTAMVSNTFNNVMSYHLDGTRDVLTTGQLDRMADTANGLVADNIVTGTTRFVDRANTCAPAGSSACAGGFGGPFQTVAQGVSVASGGDIVLIRVGHYNEPMTITKAITFRATRGDALIGKP
jgi:hypothetical protein